MQQRIAIMALVLGTILTTLSMFAAGPAGAETVSSRGTGSDPFGIDGAESERAPVKLDY